MKKKKSIHYSIYIEGPVQKGGVNTGPKTPRPEMPNKGFSPRANEKQSPSDKTREHNSK